MPKLYYTILGEGIDGPVSVAGAADAVWEIPGGDKNGFRFMLLKAEPELPACTSASRRSRRRATSLPSRTVRRKPPTPTWP